MLKLVLVVDFTLNIFSIHKSIEIRQTASLQNAWPVQHQWCISRPTTSALPSAHLQVHAA
jgi:hypothetical protein